MPTPELQTFVGYSWDSNTKYVYVGAGGFEDRAVRGAELLAGSAIHLAAAVILEFRSRNIPQHQQNERKIRSILDKKFPTAALFEMQTELVEQIPSVLGGILPAPDLRVIVDVSAMPHSLVLRALRTVSNAGHTPLVVFTEAEDYYPRKRDAEKYLAIDDDEVAFDAAANQENKHIMYAGLASVGVVKGFEGRITPTAPTSIILFPTFKRLRISSILTELEVKTRVFVLSKPEREDLRWRERALRIINYDLVDFDTDHFLTVSTLSPKETFNELCRLFERGILTPRGNTIICPHGSKMQTVGVWQFCDVNPEVRVILSHPTEFFPKKYSVGFRETFIYEPSFQGAEALLAEVRA